MCNTCREEIINIQTGEVLDLKRVEGLPENNLLKIRPDLWIVWNFEKNNELGYDIWNMKHRSGYKVWWLCEDKYHPSYDIKICHRTKGMACPYCSNRRLLVGYNDMNTTNPELARLLANPNDGYKYMQSSKQKLDWKCPDCKSIIKDKFIYSIKNQGLKCPACSDGISYPEKFMYHLLKQLDVEFYFQKTFKWSNTRRFDFFLKINNKSVIIETHGRQHDDKGFEGVSNRTVEEEKENDQYKYELAIKNSIDEYVVIDCKYSEMDYIKNNILKSKLTEIFDLSNVDWIEIGKKALSSFVLNAIELFNEGYPIKDISKELKINRNTIVRYLKAGYELRLCSYYNPSKRKVVQLDLKYNFIKQWDSLTEINNELKFSLDGIILCCKGERGSSNNYIWLYAEDYEYCLNNKISIKRNLKNKNSKPVIKLDYDFNFIKEYDSITEAKDHNNLKTGGGITECCNGNRATAGGFKWMYKEDYEKFIKGEKEVNLEIKEKTRRIIQLSMDGQFIKEWHSIKEAVIQLDLGYPTSIAICLCGNRYSAHGFRWMYVEEYNNYKEKGIPISTKEFTKRIIQLDKEGNFIKEWKSTTEACKELNIKSASAIRQCLIGKVNSSNGFKWIYKDEYLKQQNNEKKIS